MLRLLPRLCSLEAAATAIAQLAAAGRAAARWGHDERHIAQAEGDSPARFAMPSARAIRATRVAERGRRQQWLTQPGLVLGHSRDLLSRAALSGRVEPLNRNSRGDPAKNVAKCVLIECYIGNRLNLYSNWGFDGQIGLQKIALKEHASRPECLTVDFRIEQSQL